jgi:gliding motility-associated-like protein
MTVTVNAGNVTPLFTQVSAVCTGGTFTLPTTSNNGITGTWSPAINNTATTTYTFAPATGQCATTATMTVVVNQPTTPTFSQVAAICSGGTFTLPTTSNNGVSGTWSPAINNTATTTYTFAPATGQCATTATMTVTVNQPTTPTFTQVAAICSGGTFTLPTTSNNGVTGTWSPVINNTTTTTYTFTPAAGQCATTATMTVTVNAGNVTPLFTQVSAVCNGGTFTLPTTSNNGISGTWSPAINNTATTTYTFTPSAGQCATTTTMTVTVNSSVTPTFNSYGPFCQNAPIIQPILPTTSNNGITGTWTPVAISTSTAGNIQYNFTPANGQCATATSITVVIRPELTPSFTQVSDICLGGTFTLPAVSNNGISGAWSPAINNTATTTYTFTPSAVAGQCATTATMTVNVVQPAVPTFTQVAPICSGGTFTLPTTSNNGIAGTWSPAINNTATTTYTFTPRPSTASCVTTTTMTVVVNQPVTTTFTQVAAICSGGSFVLPTTSNNGVTGTWSPAINNTSTTTYTFTPTAGQCATTSTMTVLINAAPPAPAVISPVTYCQGKPAQTLSATGTSLLWYSVSSGGSGSAAAPTPGTQNIGAVNYFVTQTINGCESPRARITVVISPNPIVSAGGPYIEIQEGSSIRLSGAAVGNSLTYIWQPINVSNTLTPLVSPSNDITYTLTATTRDGCTASDTVRVVVLKELVIPNVFSPNGDNINDTWVIEHILRYQSAKIDIFNRYGLKVYSTVGYAKAWDGTYKGNPLPVGTYFYVIQIGTNKKPLSGSVSIIR